MPAPEGGKHVVPLDTSPLAAKVGEWAERVLGTYLRDKQPARGTGHKDINDPVAQIVQLRHWEAYVLDSPVMQRLRYIRQLGVGHLLFPTAGYSRFEHSIGALQTVTRMFDAVTNPTNVPHSIADDSRTLEAKRHIVRMAALLHDCGHCVLSHVSERHYASSPLVAQAAEQLGKQYQTRVTAAEALSVLIVRSVSFRRLLEQSAMPTDVFSIEDAIAKICACIAGSKRALLPDAYLAELVNGPVDCDKLDYIARDAHAAGVPVALDIDRLLSKLRVGRLQSPDGEELYALTVLQSGTRALDELLVSRIFLFDKFYYHSKVMAAEELFRRALVNLEREVPRLTSAEELLGYGDDEFLALTPEFIGWRYKVNERLPGIVHGCELLTRLRHRDLPKRVFAFAQRFLPELSEVRSRFEQAGKGGVIEAGKFEFDEKSSVLGIARYREDAESSLRAYAGQLKANCEIFIGVQQASRAAGHQHLPVALSSGELEIAPNYLFKSSEWTEAYALNKQTQYVFADSAFEEAYLAAERYFLESDLSFAPNSHKMAKVNPARIDDLRKSLDGEWLPQRLPSDYLRHKSATKRVRELGKKFSAFLSELDSSFGPQLIDAWLSQFDDGDLVESAISLLEHVTFVDQGRILAGYLERVRANPVLKDYVWVPLRARVGPGKSADRLNYDLKDLGVEVRPIGSVRSEDIGTSRGVVFFDDGLFSGVQSSCLLGSWFGAEACENQDDMDGEGSLDPDMQQALREAPTRFEFYAAHDVGIEALRTAAAAAGLGDVQISGVIKAHEPQYTLEGLSCSGAASRDRLERFLVSKGAMLLGDRLVRKGGPWSAERAKAWSLGFNAIQSTVVFSHGVSTAVPVALWEASYPPDLPWLPVFPRRRQRFREFMGWTKTESAARAGR